MEEEEIGHYFPEIFKTSANCKYGNCTHRQEPGCAVRKAVEEHYISESRYTSYLSMLEDKEEGNTARHTESLLFSENILYSILMLHLAEQLLLLQKYVSIFRLPPFSTYSINNQCNDAVEDRIFSLFIFHPHLLSSTRQLECHPIVKTLIGNTKERIY